MPNGLSGGKLQGTPAPHAWLLRLCKTLKLQDSVWVLSIPSMLEACKSEVLPFVHM